MIRSIAYRIDMDYKQYLVRRRRHVDWHTTEECHDFDCSSYVLVVFLQSLSDYANKLSTTETNTIFPSIILSKFLLGVDRTLRRDNSVHKIRTGLCRTWLCFADSLLWIFQSDEIRSDWHNCFHNGRQTRLVERTFCILDIAPFYSHITSDVPPMLSNHRNFHRKMYMFLFAWADEYLLWKKRNETLRYSSRWKTGELFFRHVVVFFLSMITTKGNHSLFATKKKIIKELCQLCISCQLFSCPLEILIKR